MVLLPDCDDMSQKTSNSESPLSTPSGSITYFPDSLIPASLRAAHDSKIGGSETYKKVK